MSNLQIFEQSVVINTSATIVENCFTDLTKMQRWLNPMLCCEPIAGERWSTDLGSKSRFVIQTPLIQPVLISTVVERRPGLVVWAFDGFFQGRDRWEVQPQESGSLLLNRFEFAIPHPIVALGFNTFAAKWTKADMAAQLKRLQQVAERETP